MCYTCTTFVLSAPMGYSTVRTVLWYDWAQFYIKYASEPTAMGKEKHGLVNDHQPRSVRQLNPDAPSPSVRIQKGPDG